ncbi:hypothetical protein AVEN_225147-1, partial [Araneus ventricosus]
QAKKKIAKREEVHVVTTVKFRNNILETGHSCSNAPPEADEQKPQLIEGYKDPDAAEEMGNLLTLPLNVAWFY